MVRITAVIRPHKLEAVKTSLAAIGVAGMTVEDVRGRGNGPEASIRLFGSDLSVALPIRAKIELAVSDGEADEAIRCILENARTGEPGDGKVFVEPLADALRIRTGERGDDGL
jgi:nitrogen regulatory protein PII